MTNSLFNNNNINNNNNNKLRKTKNSGNAISAILIIFSILMTLLQPPAFVIYNLSFSIECHLNNTILRELVKAKKSSEY